MAGKRPLRVFERDGIKLTIPELRARVPSLSHGAAFCRLRNWEQGKTEFANLFKPHRKRVTRDEVSGPDHQHQMVLPREREFLNKIPGPTEYERKYL